jgi:hypothetical protein
LLLKETLMARRRTMEARYLLSGLYHFLGGLLPLAVLALAIVLFIKAGRTVN